MGKIIVTTMLFYYYLILLLPVFYQLHTLLEKASDIQASLRKYFISYNLTFVLKNCINLVGVPTCFISPVAW